ncbi:histidine kinase [Lysobacter sp. F60174L2]|uniref:histidine kinase n=1 Tax=Lysobacter sp. F60174L2 TaxID=3459295 RepID=UPI00403E25D1
MTQRIMWSLVMALLGGLTQLISIQPWLPWPHDHMVWLPGATLMCALLSRPKSDWLACITGSILGATTLLVAFGMAVTASASIMLGLLILVALASGLMRSLRRPVSPLEDYHQVALFLLVAAIALPLSGAGWVWLMIHLFGLQDLVESWISLFLAHSVAYLLLLPGFIAMVRLRRHPERRPDPSKPQGALCLVFALALCFAWVQPWPDPVTRPMLALAATMLLMWTLLVFGIAGAFIALFCCTFLSMLASSLGLGPLVMETQSRTTLAVQLWALSASVLLLLLTPLSEQRQTARLSLESAYDRLADLTHRMLRVQEEERARIARDLHDDINQSLASISIQLSAVKRQVPREWSAQVEDLQERLLEVSSDVRRISHELHPSLLRYTSLAAALQDLCDSHHVEHGARLHCNVVGDLALDNDQKLNLFRIAQEAIHNVSRHARARNAWVRLQTEAGEIVLRVDDDGIGLPAITPEGSIRRGLGMISIEERARLLGGTSNLQPREEGGCRLEVRFISQGSGTAPPTEGASISSSQEARKTSLRGTPDRAAGSNQSSQPKRGPYISEPDAG